MRSPNSNKTSKVVLKENPRRLFRIQLRQPERQILPLPPQLAYDIRGLNNPGADAHGLDALKYDRQADERSWKQMQLFFEELFQGP